MNSRFQRLKSSISSSIDTISHYSKQLGSFLAASTKQSAESHVAPLVDGVTSVAERGFFREILKADKTRDIYLQATLANVTFLGKYLAYELGMTALRSLPYVEDSVILSSLVASVDWAAFMYMTGEAGNLVVDNTFYALSLAKKANDEVLKKNSTYKPCQDCGSMPLLQAGPASSYYHLAHTALFTIPQFIPYGRAISFPMLVYLTGRGFAEYQMVGVCTAHRSGYLANSKLFSFGVGLGLEALLWGASYSIGAVTNVRSSFINYALFNMLSHYYTVVAHTIKMPVSENKTGKDILYVTREGFRSSLEAGYESILANIPFSSEQVDLTWVKNIVRQFFLKRKSAELYLETYEEIIQRAIKEIESRRITPGLKEISYYNQRMSLPIAALKNNREVLRVIFDDNVGAVFSFIKNLMIERRLNKADPKLATYLLTDNDKDIITKEIEGELKRLRKQDERKLDKANFKTCLDKLEILEELYNKVAKAHHLHEARDIIKVWHSQHEKLINAHRSMLVGFFKKTETADFVDELIAFAFSEVTEAEGAEGLRHNEIIQKIQERLVFQQELISYYKIDDHKAQALNELDLLINNESYKHLSFNQIFSVWKEYNWYIIEAHRYVSTTIKNGLAAYFTDEYEASHTRTVKFLEHLAKQYADSSRPDISSPSLSPKIVPIVKQVDAKRLEERKAYYSDLIDEEVRRLQQDQGSQKKVTALKLLQETINRQTEDFSIADIVDKWKIKGNWAIVNMHRSKTSGMLSVFSHTVGAGPQLTDTAKFINELVGQPQGLQLQLKR